MTGPDVHVVANLPDDPSSDAEVASITDAILAGMEYMEAGAGHASLDGERLAYPRAGAAGRDSAFQRSTAHRPSGSMPGRSGWPAARSAR